MLAAASSSSSSSSPLPPKKYDVFINFNGDTNFTSHLYTALCQKSISTYVDYELPKGDDISKSLLQAIKDSSAFVVVFSENYASSKWCLDVLTQILHCREHQGRIVIPVFYKVNPSDVRKQSGSYKEAFAKHERDFIHNQHKVNDWRKALHEAANMSGWASLVHGDESEFIQNIVNDVLQKLNLNYRSALEDLVGIDKNCHSIELLLEKTPKIGIWGMGGIGKTTMARVVFAKLSSQFESCCFLENITEGSKKFGLSYIHDKLMHTLLGKRNITDSIPAMRPYQKVFIVLDDVSSSLQLQVLPLVYKYSRADSRFIITTRDKHLLKGRVDRVYEAKALNYQESLQLFSFKAFHEGHPKIGYEQLSKRAVIYAQGIPLALIVLGSFLYSKTIEVWYNALKNAKKTLDRDILEVLKLSYDELNHDERDIFLSIACFLKDETKKHAITVLDCFGFRADIGLTILENMALITIDDRVRMNDLIQKMGWTIFHQECTENPTRHSRLWDIEQVSDILKNNGVSKRYPYIFRRCPIIASSSSSYSHAIQIKHDVYISFRGSNIRHGFLSHLTKELRRKDIDVYVDNRLENRDEEMSLALFNAIEGSMISLVIFSKDYASTSWCLEELVQIMECKEVNNQVVIPIFFDVDISDVWHQKGTYEDAFAQHEQKFNIDKLQIWRSALKSAANISGYEYSSFECESTLIEAIVSHIMEKLDHIRPREPARLAGIGHHLTSIELLLKRETSAVQIIGIWGAGGIGKTTIAQAAFDKFSSQYECCCFLKKVREESQNYGLSSMKKQLLSELLEGKSNFLKNRLSRKKVLIVLDDVSTPQQIKYLIKEQISLGRNSRVIVTSRDRDVLSSGGADAFHEVTGLDFEDSLFLFCINAFNKSQPEKGYEALSKKAIAYIGGIPLCLKVLGSFLHSRNMETWEGTLKKLKMCPRHEQTQNVLKLSYDGLDPTEKDIFLDIAFFYKGKHKDDVIRLLDEPGFASRRIIGLLGKALINISYNCIEMHDLIQNMGWEIVREQSMKDSGRRTRLRDNEEVYEVLKDNKGNHVIKGILLNMSQIRDVRLRTDTFQKMTNLKFLKFHSFGCTTLHLPKSTESFSCKLRYLQWDEYPLKSLTSIFCPKNLVELHMRCSLVEKLWDGVQDLVNLRRVDLWGSKQLKELPDFSNAPNLKWMELSDCRSLGHIDHSLLSLPGLVYLGLWGCENLKRLQSYAPLGSLEQLDICGCSDLNIFSFSVGEIMDLRFSPFSIKIVHWSDRKPDKVASLCFDGSRLQIFQPCLEEPGLCYSREVNDKLMLNIKTDFFCSLQKLYLEGCSDFCYLSESVTCLSSLHELRLKGCGIKSLPACIKFLEKLEMLDLSDCKRLESLPELPEGIKHLNVDNCISLKSDSVVTSLQRNYSITFLSLINCMELCESGIMEHAYLSFLLTLLKDNTSTRVYYPGGRVPEWFKINQETNASITIELSPSSGDLKGFVYCFVLGPFKSEKKCKIHWKCQCYFQDDEKDRCIKNGSVDLTTELSSDHVFLFHDGFYRDEIKRLLDKRRDDQGTAHSQKLSFEFSIVIYENAKHDDLVKEWGVCPMYISKDEKLLQQKELERQNMEGSSRMLQSTHASEEKLRRPAMDAVGSRTGKAKGVKVAEASNTGCEEATVGEVHGRDSGLKEAGPESVAGNFQHGKGSSQGL